MKATTLKNRLEKRFTGSKNTVAYQILKSLTESPSNGLIRPCYTSGSGRFTKNMDYTEDLKAILRLAGVKFESGNDSPKGGKPGNYIKILTKIEY